MPSLAQMLAEKQAKEKAAKEAAEAAAKAQAAAQARAPAPISMSPSPDKAIELKPQAKIKESCEFCGKEFTNISAHVKKCKDNPENAEPAPIQALIDIKSEIMKIAAQIKADVIQALKTEIEGLKMIESEKKSSLDVESIKASITEAIKVNNPVFDLEPIKADIIKAFEASKQQPGSQTTLIDVKTGEKGITTEGLRFFVESFIKPRCRETGQGAKNLLTRAHKGKILTVMLDVDSLVDK